MRWPFGPPHLTLEPSQTNKQTPKKTKRREKKNNKTENYQKKNFQLSIIFIFFGGCPTFPFFDNLANKARTQKHSKNMGFNTAFLKKRYASRNGHFWKKIQKFQLSLFLPISSFSTTKTQQLAEPPDFYSLVANLEKDDFQNLDLKHSQLKNPEFAPFLKKAILENCQIIGNQQKHKMITEQQKSPETTITIGRKWPWTS